MKAIGYAVMAAAIAASVTGLTNYLAKPPGLSAEGYHTAATAALQRDCNTYEWLVAKEAAKGIVQEAQELNRDPGLQANHIACVVAGDWLRLEVQFNGWNVPEAIKLEDIATGKLRHA